MFRFYKIASQENTDINLIRRVAKTGKPIIISTVMATLEELSESVFAAREAGCSQLTLLKCTSTYPASAENKYLNGAAHERIFRMRGRYIRLYNGDWGRGVSVPLGVSVIEKHFTLNRKDGVDSDFSMEPAEMAQLVAETDRAWKAFGDVSYGPINAETIP